MGRNKKPTPVVDPWEVGSSCCGIYPDETPADVQPEETPEPFKPRGGFRDSGDVGSLAQALKGRNAKARSKTTEPKKRSRKKVSDVLSRIMGPGQGQSK